MPHGSDELRRSGQTGLRLEGITELRIRSAKHDVVVVLTPEHQMPASGRMQRGAIDPKRTIFRNQSHRDARRWADLQRDTLDVAGCTCSSNLPLVKLRRAQMVSSE